MLPPTPLPPPSWAVLGALALILCPPSAGELHGKQASLLAAPHPGNAQPSLREQRASRDLYGAKRYMDRNFIEEAQNILEEDDDLRGATRLA